MKDINPIKEYAKHKCEEAKKVLSNTGLDVGKIKFGIRYYRKDGSFEYNLIYESEE